ncbi:MAG TPA: hypothetical protein VHD36_03640 [Pirellulales bacterium]|nr:hypothetical protein [Pirellulales bacterium]
MPTLHHCVRLLGMFAVASVLAQSAAAQPPVVTRILERIPRTTQELAAAHEKSDLICAMLPQGVPLAERSFVEQEAIDVDVRRGGGLVRERVVLDFGRWPVIDYGTLMTEGDRKQLPFFTSGMILDVIDNTYVSLQARVQRASPDGAPYLSYIPVACAGEYGKTAESTEFAALQQSAVSNVHGLGLFLKRGERATPETLRTLVVSINGSRIRPNKDPEVIETVPTLELLFIRMRMKPVAAGQSPAEGVQLYAFGTTDNMTKLVSFAPYSIPKDANDCTIRSTVRITEYGLAGQLPSARAARQVRVRTAKEFTFPQLNEYVRSIGLEGEALDHPAEIFDAIIDGKLR